MCVIIFVFLFYFISFGHLFLFRFGRRCRFLLLLWVFFFYDVCSPVEEKDISILELWCLGESVVGVDEKSVFSCLLSRPD